MSMRRLVITAVVAGLSQSEVARTYGVSQGWVSRLMAAYREHGEDAFEPASRAPRTSPHATPPAVVELVVTVRHELSGAGLDAGADTIAWHLAHHHDTRLSRATIHRILTRAGAVTPQPRKRPKSSYIRFQADQPNECWQSDFTHYRLTRPDGSPGRDVEIITWLDDHSRYALHATAHTAITARIVRDTFRQAGDQHGYPAATLTDNGLVYTVRLASQARRGGRTMLENELRRRGIVQKNGRPASPTTQGKVERFQQTMKKWLTAQPDQPATINALQTLIDAFLEEYNHHRPHRSLPHHATPVTAYTTRPKAAPGTDRSRDTHDRVRHDRVSKAGSITLRHDGTLYRIGIGKTYTGTYVLALIHDLDITVINAATGEILRDLTLDPTRLYQPINQPQKQRMARTYAT
ncbi:IS481 family transposase [Raineyella sp.]|uniref:IS481 family transposase n=1 Tax=Raineyella sp. TaxID=1911550 RepID=UPI002B1EB13C|nr:IS481 family transposase [Raineyella sp.]MEA5153831.1 IS481 family transposase [Raineyella sp.]